jgi:hypothetical protein
MGIYGNGLRDFPEQYRTVEYFNMTPNMSGGYDPVLDDDEEPVEPTDIEGVLQNTGKKGVKDSNGNIAYVSSMEFWSEDELELGWFIKFNDVTFRLIPANDWSIEDGFYRYGLEKLIGDDGSLTNDVEFNNGMGNI